MIARFEELDWQQTRMGELTLRRRADPSTGEQIYEVKLKDEYLMSSLFTVAEEELATLGLAAAEGADLTCSWAVWAWATRPRPRCSTIACDGWT